MRRPQPDLALLLAGLMTLAAALAVWLLHLDAALHPVLLARAQGVAAMAASRISALGGSTTMIPVALVAVVGLAIRRRGREALWVFGSIALGRIVVESIKFLAHRPRPPAASWLEPVSSWSFPSSHSAGAMMTALAIALGARRPAIAIGIAIAWSILVGWSRLALGVHWVSDVLGGWGFAMVWIGVAAYFRPARKGS